ncbi:MAG TPA: hypothetical protein VE891_15900 [Allosphingosinicella sp.]|nr:hypothetical protein [Allosphingosinicella sp.]
MTDPDRDREIPREPIPQEPIARETVRDTERTTIIQTGGDRDRGGGGVILAVVLLLALLALLYFLFSGSFNRAADSVGVNVNVEAPKVDMPNIEMPDKIELKVPEEIEVTTDGGGNKSN